MPAELMESMRVMAGLASPLLQRVLLLLAIGALARSSAGACDATRMRIGTSVGGMQPRAIDSTQRRPRVTPFRQVEGKSWVSLGLSNLAIVALVSDPSSPSTLYAAGGEPGTLAREVWKSTDAGGTWSPADAGLEGVTVSVLAIDPTTPRVLYAGASFGASSASVYKTIDGGLHWAAAGAGLPPMTVNALAVDPNSSSTIYAGTTDSLAGGAVFRSLNGGSSWAEVDGLPNASVSKLVVTPTTPAIVYAATVAGAFKRVGDAGAWLRLDIASSPVAVSALGTEASSPTTLYAGTPSVVEEECVTRSGGLFRSSDGGASWMEVGDGLPNINPIAIAVDESQPGVVYVAAQRFECGRHVPDAVLGTTNAGVSWTLANRGLPDAFVFTLAIGQSSSTTLYAGTSEGVFAITFAGIPPPSAQVLEAGPSRPASISPVPPRPPFSATCW